MRKSCWFLALLLLVLDFGCGRPKGRPLTLASGTEVKVISRITMHHVKGESALVVKYETTIPLTDIERLGLEADEVWKHFSSEADRAGLHNGGLTATEPSTGGFVSVSKSYTFRVTKLPDGTWQRVRSKEPK